ncbi:head-tail connector protein [Sporohalobacter salinus]|uniref:head-tail connector protein n=1 Tax=Sporohalobacter salinus TaxID=1494606 RepID=UPI0019613678|nr:head-tail connector protein [Sporohalobacter salinus]MBM7624778.1 hypothetical protein [Sporohalobacter salinus]
MTLIDEVKTALRVTTTELDSEIEGLIEACKVDLEIAGLYVVDETDKLIKRAIILYCKANFGYDNPEADRFQESYEMLKNHLAMSVDYAYYTVTFEIIKQTKVEFDGEIKETNANGKVVFYSREKNHVPYKIGDGDIKYIDINSDMTVSG